MRGFDSRWALIHSAYGKVWQFRLLRKQEIVGSNPTAPTRLRWGPCWYGQAPVKRTDTGSIPVVVSMAVAQPAERQAVNLVGVSSNLTGHMTMFSLIN